jgi:DNA repair protein RadC
MIVDTAQVAAGLLARELGARNSAGVAALHLDDERHLLAATFSPAQGGEGELPVRDILAAALGVGAASIVVGQVRRGRSLEPDASECAASRRLAEASAAAGIRLMDHIVFDGDQCRSFRELGLL